MTLLPVEIWRHIVNHGGLRSRDLCALSTTSALFRPLSQEVLYENVTFSRQIFDDIHGDEVSVEIFPAKLLIRSVTERPELGALVRNLFIKYLSEDSSTCDRYVDSPILSNLALFYALRQLTVHGFFIDTEFMATLQSHPHLTSIEFSNCYMSEMLIEMESQKSWSGTSISSVTITDPQLWRENAWAAVCPAGIRSLEFIDDEPDIVDEAFSNILLVGITSALTSLSMSTSVPNLIHILMSSPQLRHFDIRGWDKRTLPFDSLPAETIPLLEEFSGPASFCRAIIRGRPVHSVKLSFRRNTPVDTLVDLQLSSVPITRLIFYGMPFGGENSKFLMHAPTSIQSFGLVCYLFSEDPMSYCPALSRLSQLMVITGFGRFHAEHVPPGKEIVHEFSKACPSLQEINFLKERWLARKDGGWERYFRED